MAQTCPQAALRAPGPTASSWALSPANGQFAGLHTEVAEAVGAAVYRAVAEGVIQWMAE
jgi:adenosylcobinamide amidohydrolase